ncbi:MAG TPA: DUF6491 family protein [Brevundimonas sp.]
MRQSLLVLIPVVGLLIGSAAAPVATTARAQTSESPAPERRCFSEQQIRNFRSSHEGTLYLKVWGSNSGTYQLATSGGCLDLTTAQQVAVTPGLGSGRLCTGDWATVATQGFSGSPQVCRALIQKRLTDAEIAALPGRDRP